MSATMETGPETSESQVSSSAPVAQVEPVVEVEVSSAPAPLEQLPLSELSLEKDGIEILTEIPAPAPGEADGDEIHGDDDEESEDSDDSEESLQGTTEESSEDDDGGKPGTRTTKVKPITVKSPKQILQKSIKEAGLDPTATKVTYVLEVTDQGAIVLKNGTGQIPQDAQSHTYFPVSLPIAQVKNLTNPIPGALRLNPGAIGPGGSGGGMGPGGPGTGQRSRKSKLEVRRIDDEFEEQFKRNTGAGAGPRARGRGSVEDSSSGASGGSEDPLGLNSTDFESALQSPQAQEILANLNPKPSTSTSSTKYPKTTFTINIQKPGGASTSSSKVVKVKSASVDLIPVESPTETDAPAQVTVTPVPVPSKPEPKVSAAAAAAAAARARRSLRQQDRSQREEAEKIMAENQKMLQKEKEMLAAAANKKKNAGAPGASTPTVAPPAKTATPKATPALKVTPVLKAHPPPTAKKTPITIPAPPPAPGSIDRPRRANRKLPAHLADPSFIDPDAERPLGGTGASGSGKEAADAEESQGEDTGATEAAAAGYEEDKDYEPEAEEPGDVEADDPTKLWCICRRPHGGRFMICCDRCDDWFHGNCVGVTKAQGDAIERENKTWNCPGCRKILKAQSQKGVAVTGSSKSKNPMPAPPAKAPVQKTPPEAERSRSGSGSSTNRRSSSSNRRNSSSRSRDKSPDIIAGSPSPAKRRQSSGASGATTPGAKEKKLPCVVCKSKSARAGSIYCGDSCVVKHSKDAGGAGASSSKKSGDSGSGASTPAAAPVPTTPTSPNKLKRLNSKSSDTNPPPPENFLAFHVIPSSGKQSTEIVPPKTTAPTKEITASALLRQQKTAAAPVPQASQSPTDPSLASRKIQMIEALPQNQNQKTPTSSPSTSTSSRKVEKSGSSTPAAPVKKESHSHSASSSSSRKRTRTSSESTSTPTTRNSTGSSSSGAGLAKKPPIPPAASTPSHQPRKDFDDDKELRSKFRSNLTSLFTLRMKELSEAERSTIPNSVTPQEISTEIEEELYKLYEHTTNQKYRNKSRTLYFNLKDTKNPLYRKILQLELNPFDLVRMETHQFANPELVEWRNRENRKELDMIRKNEIEKIAEAKKIELLESGVEIEKVEEETRATANVVVGELENLPTVSIPTEDSNSNSGYSEASSSIRGNHSNSKHRHSSGSHSAHKSSSSRHHSSSSSSHHDKDKSKHRHHGSSSRDQKSSSRHHSSSSSSSKHHKSSSSSRDKDRHRSSTSSHSKRHSSGDHDKDKDNSRASSRTSNNSDAKSTPKDKDKSSEVSTSKKIEETPVPPPPQIDENSSSSIFSNNSSPAGPETASAAAAETEPDQELPSSTIKTPDFLTSDEPSSSIPKHLPNLSTGPESPIITSQFIMPDIGQFSANLYHCSHNSANLTQPFFPDCKIPIVGRIPFGVVWDYLDKMKKTKEVVVFRLAPSSPTESDGYQALFKYFSSRDKLAVCGGISHPFKDIYLYPQQKNCPINQVLLPFRGPGLPDPPERSHCFLAIVTRHLPADPHIAKRKSIGHGPTVHGTGKRMKLSGDIKPGLISSTLSLNRHSKIHDTKQSPTSGSGSKDQSEEDDNEPYSPKDEEPEKSTTSAPAPAILPLPVVPIPPAPESITDIEAKIAQTQQEFERISAALSARTPGSNVIPGLDGEFGDEDDISDTELDFEEKPSSSSASTTKKAPAPPQLPIKIPDVIDIESDEDEEAPYSPSTMDY